MTLILWVFANTHSNVAARAKNYIDSKCRSSIYRSKHDCSGCLGDRCYGKSCTTIAWSSYTSNQIRPYLWFPCISQSLIYSLWLFPRIYNDLSWLSSKMYCLLHLLLYLIQQWNCTIPCNRPRVTPPDSFSSYFLRSLLTRFHLLLTWRTAACSSFQERYPCKSVFCKKRRWWWFLIENYSWKKE
jgi:hypothetical protein